MSIKEHHVFNLAILQLNKKYRIMSRLGLFFKLIIIPLRPVPDILPVIVSVFDVHVMQQGLKDKKIHRLFKSILNKTDIQQFILKKHKLLVFSSVLDVIVNKSSHRVLHKVIFIPFN